MDPQQRLALELGVHACAKAGLWRRSRSRIVLWQEFGRGSKKGRDVVDWPKWQRGYWWKTNFAWMSDVLKFPDDGLRRGRGQFRRARAEDRELGRPDDRQSAVRRPPEKNFRRTNSAKKKSDEKKSVE